MIVRRGDFRQEVRARFVTDEVVASVLVWDWQTPVSDHDAGYDRTMLNMLLSPRAPGVKASVAGHGPSRRYSPIGDIMLLRPHETIHAVSGRGRQVALQCIFKDLEFGAWGDAQAQASLDISSTTIRQTCQRLSAELEHPGFAHGLAIDALCRLLKADLHRHFAGVSVDAPLRAGGLAQWRLNRIDERIAADGTPPALAELALLCGMSVRHLSRAFRQSRGEAIAAYAARIRIGQAKHRLRASSVPIAQIAADLGFATPAAFSSAFRAAVGATPRDFRARLLGPDADKGCATSDDDVVCGRTTKVAAARR